MGFAGGVAVAFAGYMQPQAKTSFNVSIGSSGGAFVHFKASDWQIPFLERMFVMMEGRIGTFKDLDLYQDGNTNFPNERAGSNQSDSSNQIKADSDDNYARMEFRYILPLGEARDNPITTLVSCRQAAAMW